MKFKSQMSHFKKNIWSSALKWSVQRFLFSERPRSGDHLHKNCRVRKHFSGGSLFPFALTGKNIEIWNIFDSVGEWSLTCVFFFHDLKKVTNRIVDVRSDEIRPFLEKEISSERTPTTKLHKFWWKYEKRQHDSTFILYCTKSNISCVWELFWI